ncbi:MAG: SWIM zinc finger family protein [Ilumatobacteraceae bacterium]
MSRPRTPFGPNQPGRLPATMVKVLAAELSDQARLARGKRYRSDGAVVDIECRPGVVTGTVQGSRRQPYEVTIVVGGGSGTPTRRDVRIVCTCPDDAGVSTPACKHAVAVLLAWSDEVAIEPGLIDVVRSSSVRLLGSDGSSPDGSSPGGSSPDRSSTDGAPLAQDRDEISAMLVSPTEGGPPDLPIPEPLEHPRIPDPLVDAVLRSALDDLVVRWS